MRASAPWLLVACAAALGCRKTEAPAPPPIAPAKPLAPSPPVRLTEQEPDDFQHAMAIPPRAVISGSIEGKRDDDWYRVETAGRTLALRVELRGAQQAALEIYDRDRNRVLRAGPTIPSVACVQACFVRVSGGPASKYELTVLGDAPSAEEEIEPNNRAADATELVAGKPMKGTFLAAGDEDWYRLMLPVVQPGQFLRVEVSAVEGVRPELEVRSLADSSLLWTARAALPGQGILVRDLSLHFGDAPAVGSAADGGADGGGDAGGDGGTDAGADDAGVTQSTAAGYFFVLRSRRGFSPLVPYTLAASLEAGPPDLEIEPNDDAPHATLLGATATGYLAPAGDEDWYRVHADAPSVLSLQLSGADAGVPQAELRRPGEKPFKLVAPAVGLSAGDNFIVVRSGNRGADLDHPYRLSAVVSPDDGSIEREPNNVLPAAQTLALPVAVKGWIWPGGDVDVFRFNVPAGRAPVSILLSAVRGVDLSLRLLEVHGDSAEIIGSSDSVRGEGEEKLLSVPLKEGAYAVEVSSPHSRDASATEAYTLRVQ